MKFSVKSGDINKIENDMMAVAVFTDGKLSDSAGLLDEVSNGGLRKALELGDIKGKAGESQMLYGLAGIPVPRILLVGCGKKGGTNRAEYEKALQAVANAAKSAQAEQLLVCLPEIKVQDTKRCARVRDAVTVISACLYRFAQCKGESTESSSEPEKIALFIGLAQDTARCDRAIEEGKAIASGQQLARDLGNLPGNICTPSYLAEQAEQLRQLSADLRVEILEEEQMEKLGMGALLSVSKGSRQPAKLIVMEYRGGKGKPVVLVGKGLTFDAGGISIKPSAQMDEMKYDMCGGASVIGAMRAVLELKLPINVVGLVPSSENLPDGDANKPGDIVTSMSGQTIEILNTDAEGRLILCDTLTYAERFDPAAVVDVATLTGACVVALGQVVSGLFSENEELASQLMEAGEQTRDRTWRLPLMAEYQDQLDSNFADMANIGGRYGGAITAACFLSRYTGKYPWAHLDIAGVAWLQGKEKGSTGRPVPMLTQFLMDRCAE